ncbi:VOC family protein [Ulvibacterium sp.]|uniref:VOC family protein n=1 Tax=Ulvibacterium sp. TaxID=2665914 RepID=UPI003BAC65F2
MKTTRTEPCRSIWLNLPVNDLQRSKQFFRDIGFHENPMHKNAEHLGSFLIGENDFVLMLFPKEQMSQWLKNKVTDTSESNEMLINIDAQSIEEVDDFAETVKKAGGTIYQNPQEVDGWMYLFSFGDLDGHCWNMLYMDTDKMPQSQTK